MFPEVWDVACSHLWATCGEGQAEGWGVLEPGEVTLGEEPLCSLG